MSTPFPITGLRSVELRIPDVDLGAVFYTSVWGLVEAARRDDVVWLRGTGNDGHVLRLERGPSAAVVSITLRAASETDLAGLRHRMIAAGATLEADIAHSDQQGGGVALSMRDEAGRVFRVVQGDATVATLADDSSRPGRLAHVNINTSDIERDIRFLVNGLGFRLTDRSAAMAFLRTNDDHHSIVLAKATCDTLNHVAFNHECWEDVMKASGRMRDARFPIGWGPGRHGPGNNVFMYFVDPFGIVIEHTAEVSQVDDSYRVGGPEDWVWPEGRVDQWGIAPPKTDDCKAAQLAIPFL